MYWLVVAVLVLAIYGALKIHALGAAQVVLATFVEEQFKQLRDAPKEVEPGLPYGWFDEGWPLTKSDEEERAPLSNPELRISADEYATRTWVVDYQSMNSAEERKGFLRKLRAADVWMPAELLDLVYADETAAVRAWAAAHLRTTCTDCTDREHPVQTRDYEPAILADTEPIVRAALWSNPECRRLPFSRWGFMLKPEDNWRESFRNMTQLERLGLMRNPHLADYYVLALLEASSEELNITRKEHTEVLRAAGLNPAIIGSSRRHGRKFWMVEGDVNPPVEQYGKMWDLCLEKWLDEPLVPLTFIKYIQTTPEKKIDAYTKFLEKADDKKFGWLRAEVIRSCDPIQDSKVLKAAWNDPNEDCQKAAARVNRFETLPDGIY